MVSEETIPPYAIFLSRVPCRIPSRKIKKTTYFKLTLPNTGIDLKLVYGIRNSLAFLLHVCTMIHTCIRKWEMMQTSPRSRNCLSCKTWCWNCKDPVHIIVHLLRKEQGQQKGGYNSQSWGCSNLPSWHHGKSWESHKGCISCTTCHHYGRRKSIQAI